MLRALHSDYLTTGPEVEAFERELAAACGAKYAVAVANGTLALELCIRTLAIGKDGLGWTSPMSFAASATCLLLCGAEVDFVDIQPQTGCMDPEALASKCAEGRIPDVVIPVSYAGIAAELPRIRELSRQYGFSVIEDAAHALGSTYSDDGREVACASCTHSDLAILSFHPVKTITTGEGGAVTTNDPLLYERMLRLRSHGVERDASKFKSGFLNKNMPWAYEVQELAPNMRITDFQCALGREQLKRLSEIKEKKATIIEQYQLACSGLSLSILEVPAGQNPCWHLCAAQIQGEDAEVKRLALFHHLRARQISPQVHYIPIHWHPLFQSLGFKIGSFPQAEDFYLREISLPLFPGMSAAEQSRVIEAVHSFMG